MKLGLLAAVIALLAVTSRSAYAGCDERLAKWVEACEARASGAPMNAPAFRAGVLRCPPGAVVFSVAIGDAAPLDVEATRGREGAFRTVAGVGLSPVGEFADWSLEPAPTRAAFDRLTACVARDPGLPILTGDPSASERPAPTRRRTLPWLLVAAVGAAALALGPSIFRRRARDLRTAAKLVGLTLLTFALRRALFEPTFFHQNAHGPMWIEHALCRASPYGPGFDEIFGWAARRGASQPEGAVFALQAGLAALGPASAWIVSRRVGARPTLAWAMAIAVAVDPLLARLALSESYYGVHASLLLIASALVAAGTITRRALSVPFVLTAVAAGLVVAQAARVHPTGWVAAALVPIVYIAAPGPIPRRLGRAALGAGIIGAVVLLTSGPGMIGVLGGETGDKWLPMWRAGLLSRAGSTLLLCLPMAAIVVRASRKPRQGAVRAAGLVTVVLAMAFGDMHRGTLDWVRGAYDHMYTAALVATLAGVLAGVVRRPAHTRLAAGAVVALALVSGAARARWLTELPTDALELRQDLLWRGLLPPGATVVGLGGAGKHLFGLQVFGACNEESGRLVPLRADDPEASLGSFGPRTFYYRSSLCSTAEGRASCEALERSALLEPIGEAELPARPSMVGHAYDAPRVRVGLYRVNDPVR